jgi:predicted nucleotidyltransferase
MSTRGASSDFPGFAALADAFADRPPLDEAPSGPPPTLRQLRARGEEIATIARRYGAHNLRVVGSVARQEAERASDVDLLIDLDDGRSLLDVSGLVIDLQDLLGCRVHVVREAGVRRPEVRRRLLAEAVPL